MADNLTVQDIYQELFAGKKIRMRFESREEMNNFKIRLHKVKLTQEEQMISIGMLSELDRQTLNFFAMEETFPTSFELFLSSKKPKQTFTVEIVS